MYYMKGLFKGPNEKQRKNNGDCEYYETFPEKKDQTFLDIEI